MPKETGEKKKGKTGRPKKFGRPTKPFYLVLPEDIVAKLRFVDHDIATAIVKVVEELTFEAFSEIVRVEVLSTERVIIWVCDIPSLCSWKGVHLLPISPGRNLLLLDDDYGLKSFELDLRDWIDARRQNADAAEDLARLEKLVEALRHLRATSLANGSNNSQPVTVHPVPLLE
ncbi:MAG: hypothetical protein H7Y22_19680 [Gemmatimonadaceae bacterium]|nr:hypothetical protein [Gloeobacterales cyanobacterium ES-bin-141]